MGARYRQIGRQVIAAIKGGALRVGERLPSLRDMCASQGISLTTAVAVYRWLEEEGWVEARPKSGYYVRLRRPALPEPGYAPPVRSQPCFVGVNDTVMRFLRATRRPDVVSLAAAVPGAALYPAAQLQRLTAQIVRRHPELLSAYALNPAGNPLLRGQIARHASSYGLSLAPDEIVVTNGAMEALNLALRAVARPGDTIAVESPVYYGMLQMIETQGLKALEIPTHPRDGISLDALELATRPPAKVAAVLLIPNFSNPLGCLMPPDNKRRLMELLGERDIPLIEDDIYGDLPTEGSRPSAVKSCDRDGRVLVCASFTKTLAPGLRVGWIAPGRYFARVEMLKFQNTVATSELPQLVIARYIESGGYERHLRRLRESFRLQKARMSDAIARYFPPGTKVSRPGGGFVLWVELPPNVDSQRLFDLALAHGVTLAPGTIFSTREEVFRHFIRLNAGVSWSDAVEGAIRTIGRLAGALARGETQPV